MVPFDELKDMEVSEAMNAIKAYFQELDPLGMTGWALIALGFLFLILGLLF